MPSKGASASCKQRLECIDTHVEDPGGIAVRKSLVVTEQKRTALPLGKVREGTTDLAAMLPSGFADLRITSAIIVKVSRVFDESGTGRGAKPVDAEIVRDIVQPGREPRLVRPKAPGTRPEAQQRFLNDVFGLRRIAEHALCVGLERPLVRPDQPGEGLAVAARHLLYQSRLGDLL